MILRLLSTVRPVPNAGSSASEASAKKRSVLLTLAAEALSAAIRGPRERHLGAAHLAAVQVRDRRFGAAAGLSKGCRYVRPPSAGFDSRTVDRFHR